MQYRLIHSDEVLGLIRRRMSIRFRMRPVGVQALVTCSAGARITLTFPSAREACEKLESLGATREALLSRILDREMHTPLPQDEAPVWEVISALEG